MLNLPPPDTRRLATSPLSLVVCQVRFGDTVAVDDARIGDSLGQIVSEIVGEPVPAELGDTPEFFVAIGAGEPMSASDPRADRGFCASHPTLTVNLGPHAIGIETTAYKDWTAFSAMLDRLLQFAQDEVKAPSESRLGLRMINQIHSPTVTAPQAFRGLIQDWLLSPLVEPALADSVAETRQQIDLKPSEGPWANIRSVLMRDPGHGGRPTFVLDFDAYRLGFRDFDAAGIRAAADEMNTFILQLFQSSLTPDYFKEIADGDTSHA